VILEQDVILISEIVVFDTNTLTTPITNYDCY